jgi:hypothetical protein
MKIRFTCDCGKTYEVPESYAGKTTRCKACEQMIRIPTGPSKADEEVEQEVEESYLSEQSSGNAESDLGHFKPLTDVRRRPSGRKMVPLSPEAQRLRVKQQALDKGQPFQALNPAWLSVNFLKYFRNFPYPLMWRVGLLLTGIGLCWFTILGILPAIFAGYLIYRHLKWVQQKYLSGCICPGKILSLNPPVLAVYVDLSISQNSCGVIRLMEQPFHLLDRGTAQPGRTAAVCYFMGLCPPYSDHWMTPLPTMPHFVTDRKLELQRVYDSIPDEQWEYLEQGLKQLPANPELRTYRITHPGYKPHLRFSSFAQLQAIARRHLSEVGGKFNAEITAESLTKATQFLKKPIELKKVVGLVESLGSGAIILEQEIVFFHREEKHKPVVVPWSAIKVAYLSLTVTEIVMRDNQRLLVPNSGTMSTQVQLEKFINEAVGVGLID